MTEMVQDLRYGVRMLRRSPGFTTVAVLTLALGVGAVTAMYVPIHQALLPDVKVRDRRTLANIRTVNLQAGVGRGGASMGNFVDWRRQATHFEAIAAAHYELQTMTSTGKPQRVNVEQVTANFFQLLGVQAIVGRAFLDGEDRPGAAPVALISDTLWKKSFGATEQVLGRSIVLDGVSYMVVGVAPHDFGLITGGGSDVWTAMPLDPAASARGGGSLTVFARLKPDATAEAAQAEMDTISARLERQYPANKGWGTAVIPVMREQYKKQGAALAFGFGPVVIVLVLACANVANLLLARMSVRATEIAVRSALGAARGRIVRQLITENTLLAVAGGGLGILGAYWGLAVTRVAVGRLQPDAAAMLHMDSQVLFFALAISILTVMLFGIAPALHAAKINLYDAMKSGGMSAGPYSGMSLNRRPMLVMEIALAVPFLVIAVLFAQSMRNIELTLARGFEQRNVLVVNLSPEKGKYRTPELLAKFYRDVQDRLAAMPGVELVAAADHAPAPTHGSGSMAAIEIESPLKTSQQPSVQTTWVTDGYLEAVRIRLLQGRTLSPTDRNQPVALVSREMASRFWNGSGAVGRRFRLAAQSGTWTTVVGVVDDIGYGNLRRTQPAAYLMMGAAPPASVSFLARTSTDPAPMVEAAKRAVWSVDQDQPLDEVAPLEQIFADEFAGSYLVINLTATLGWLALLLAVIGVYSVTSYSVAQRTREFGVRIALGAQRGDILRMVLASGGAIAATGIAVGALMAWALVQLVRNELAGVSTVDPLSFGGTAAVLAAAALVASYIPARRAIRVDPMVALRYE